ncbi:MAG TPA: acyl carrier protein [Bryobacteraceae bacterium]|nr:acyl carrier protein [Bryobacteraceae bacterium]
MTFRLRYALEAMSFPRNRGLATPAFPARAQIRDSLRAGDIVMAGWEGCMASNNEDILSAVIEIIHRVANLSDIEPDQDIYDAGMTSVMALPLLLDLEDCFGVAIPDDRFIASRTARALELLITDLKPA